MIGIIGCVYRSVSRRAKINICSPSWKQPEHSQGSSVQSAATKEGWHMALNTVTIDICFYYNERQAHLEKKLHLSKSNGQLSVFL